MKTELNIGQAVEALKNGKRVAREGWNGKNMFVFMQVPSVISKDIVPKMQSLPQSVKDEFQRRFDVDKTDAIYYNDQIAMVRPSNTITSWSPSVSDLFANDWYSID